MKIDVETIRKLTDSGNILWSQHCVERMQQRMISRESVLTILRDGEIIESYENDFPHPSCLILGFDQSKPIHVVCGCDMETVFVVTAYEPDAVTFENDYKTRRCNEKR